jgi:xylan 1,4-beta-xylosidase
MVFSGSGELGCKCCQEPPGSPLREGGTRLTCHSPLAPFLLLALASTLPQVASAQTRDAAVTVDFAHRGGALEIDRMALGQGGLSEEPMWDGRIAEIKALRPRLIRLFVQEYFDLLPARGLYHFDTLDRSVDTIKKTGAEPLLCICFKPRVLFPTINHDMVAPNDEGEWERLITRLVRHVKERGGGVRYWEIANEPDIGESGGCPYRFQPESYLRYYRQTASAVLRGDPGARVGGPAVANVHSPILPALLDACDQEKTPLHFISWHIYSSSPAAVRGTIEYAKGLLEKHPALKPETMLDEWNMALQNPPLEPRFQPCFILETIWQMKDAGLDWSCYYHIRDYHVDHDTFAPFLSARGTAFMTRWWNRMPQFDGLFDFQNRVRPSYFAFKLLSRLTGDRLRIAASDPAIHAFATHDETYQIDQLLLWNFSDAPASVDLAWEHLPRELLVRPFTLDAQANSDDENARLRPDRSTHIKQGDHHLRVSFDPYAIKFWSFE